MNPPPPPAIFELAKVLARAAVARDIARSRETDSTHANPDLRPLLNRAAE